MAAALTLATPQAPLQLMSHADSGTCPSTLKPGSVHSATKSTKICDFMAMHFSKSTTCYPLADSTGAISVIKMPFNNWLVGTLIVCAST
jgi:hypothetical protein